jgi:hypothetical protein
LLLDQFTICGGGKDMHVDAAFGEMDSQTPAVSRFGAAVRYACICR